MGNRTFCPYRNFSQAIIILDNLFCSWPCTRYPATSVENVKVSGYLKVGSKSQEKVREFVHQLNFKPLVLHFSSFFRLLRMPEFHPNFGGIENIGLERSVKSQGG